MQRAFSKKRVFMMLALSASSIWLGQARADTPVSWANTSASGNWSVAADWTPAVSPNGAYAVTLPTGSETVTLDVSPTIDSLVLANGTTLQTNAGISLTTSSLNNSGQVNFTSGGILTVNGATTNSGPLVAENGTTVSITGNVANSNNFWTTVHGGANNTVNVSGTFTNNSGGNLSLYGSGDVVNVNALNNQAFVLVNGGATLNITGGGLGVTDVPSGSEYDVYGNFNVINGVVTTSALAHLASVEGNLELLSGQTYHFGALTNSGQMVAENGTTVSVAGNVTNGNNFWTTVHGGANNTVSVSGTFTNNSGGNLSLYGSGDVVNVNALNNQAFVLINSGAALNITGGGLGVTDVTSSSEYDLDGNFNIVNGAVTTSALAHLASVEGNLGLLSGQIYHFGPLTNSGQIAAENGTTVSITGNVTNSNNFWTTVHGGASNTVSVSGAFTNSSGGNLSLFGSGDIVKVNALNNQGNVTVDPGAFLGVGSGSFSASSGYQQLANGTFDEIIGGAGTFGTANISGPMALGGTLDVTLANGFTPTLGESFTFLDGTPAELSGAYAGVVGQPFAGGQWLVGYNDAAGTVTLTAAVPEPTSIAMLCVAGFGLLRRRRQCVQR
jgi:hypothetical protein